MAGKIALIGGDNPHAKGWLETAANCPDISEVVLCGDWGDHGGKFDTVSDIKGLEEGPSVEMALVCARNVDAPKWAKQLLQAGIPTLVEKPVARTSAEVAELNVISASSGVLIIGQMMPMAPASKSFMMMPGSIHGTRAIGVTSLNAMA